MIKGKTDYDKRNLLNAARFLGGGDLTPLELPEIEGENGKPSVVLLRRPSAGRILSIRATGDNESAREGLLFKLIAECVVGEDGKRLFTEDQEAALLDMPATVFGRLTNALMDLANTASIVAGTATEAGGAEGNAPSGAVETAYPTPAVPLMTAPASTAGSASPTSSASTLESGT